MQILSQASVHKLKTLSRRNIHNMLYSGSSSASLYFDCIELETLQNKLLAAVNVTFVSTCWTNWPNMLMYSWRSSEKRDEIKLHISFSNWNTILMRAIYLCSLLYPSRSGLEWWSCNDNVLTKSLLVEIVHASAGGLQMLLSTLNILPHPTMSICPDTWSIQCSASSLIQYSSTFMPVCVVLASDMGMICLERISNTQH